MSCALNLTFEHFMKNLSSRSTFEYEKESQKNISISVSNVFVYMANKCFMDCTLEVDSCFFLHH